MNLDHQLFFKINGLVGKNKVLDKISKFFGQILIYLATLLLIILSFLDSQLDILMPFVAFVFLAFSWIISLSIGLIVRRQRPFIKYPNKTNNLIKPLLEQWKSFPSDHAMIMTVICFTSLLFNPFYITLLGLVFLILIAWGRVYCGVHYPADILGGITVGLIVPIGIILLTYFLFSKSF